MTRNLVAVLVTALVPLGLAACATDEAAKPLSWEEAEVSTSRSTGSGPKRSANDFHSDDACVSEAERRLRESREQAMALMRGCLVRDDFALVSVLAEKRWKGLELTRKDWPAVMRAELRRGTISDLDLSRYGIPSTWLRGAPPPNTAPGDMFLLHGEAVEARESAGKPGWIVHPIVYGSRTEINEYMQHWDLVRVDGSTGQKTVVQKDAKVTLERDVKNLKSSHVIKQPVLIQLDQNTPIRRGTGILCIVDKVRAGAKAKDVVYDEEGLEEDDGEDGKDAAPLPIRQFVHAVACVSTSE